MNMHIKAQDKQIKLVIVDDEPLVIEGLKSMIDWAKYNIIVMNTFEQSELAFKYIAHNPVDLLITDVRMPGMDGLELIHKIKKMQPRLKVLVMSGYRDFDYVKQAMIYGASNYLVKPVFEEDLSPLLLEIQKEINSRDVEAFYCESGQIEMLKKFLTEKDMESQVPSSELMEYYDATFSKGDWLFCILWKGFTKIDREIVMNTVGETIEEWIELLYQNHGILVLVRCDSSRFENKLLNQDYITKWNTLVINHDIMQLKELFLDCNRILPQCHHYQRSSKIDFFIEHSNWNDKTQEVPIDRIASEFVDILHHRDKKLLVMKIQDELEQWERLEFPIDLLLNTMILIYETIVEKIRKLMDINYFTASVFDVDLPLHMCTVEDIVLFFEEKLFILLTILEESKVTTKDSFKVMVEGFIDEHYAENITIKELADFVHMHPTYLGQKLSQLWGEGFTQRIHRIRIQKSVDYLNSMENISIEEIAFKVGYHHYHVFLKYFKKYMEKTPKEYVRNVKNQ